MKLAVGFLLLCAILYAEATNNSSSTKEGALQAPVADGIMRFGLELILTKLEQIDHKLMKLQPDYQTRQPDQTPPTPDQQHQTTIIPKPKLAPLTSCKNAPANASGVYLISVNNDSAPFNVYCEQEKFGGGWIVVQHRFNGSVDFYRNWDEYKNGFGELDSEFWLGLEQIHQITSARAHEIIFEMKDFEGIYKYARYKHFKVSSESHKYSLKALGSYSGTAGDSMSQFSKGAMFSTKDRNNEFSTTNWAVYFEGAWWYGSGGGYSNLNGRYKNSSDGKSAWWFNFKSGTHGLSFTRMMIRQL